MFKDIKSKTTALVCLIIIVLALFQIAANLVFGQAYYVQNRKAVTMQAFNKITKSTTDDELEEAVNSFEGQHNLRITIFGSDYELIYSSRNQFMQKSWQNNERKPKLDENKAKMFSKTPDVVMREDFRQSQPSLVLLGISQDQTRYIEIETYVSAIEQSIKVTNEFAIMVVLIALIAGAALAYFFAGKYAEPIKQLNEIAKRVSNLDFSVKADVGSQDELGELANSVNAMSTSLENFVAQLQAANARLQSDLLYKDKIEQMRKQFVANVSHELKTPLAMLMSYSEVLKHDYAGIDKEYYYDVIIDESAKMNTLVNSLLDISALENGLSNICQELVDFDVFIEQCCAKYYLLMEQKNISHSFNAGNCPETSLDCAKIDQVVKNYISNAISHTTEGGEIKMHTQFEQGKSFFYIHNQGSHISIEEQERIWEIFYKSDAARTRKENSTGIGLYVVRTIINAHNGDFGSKNTSDGVEFWFNL